MNSLNIISARVVGQIPQSPSSAKFSRSRSVSDIVSQSSTVSQKKRSASQHEKAGSEVGRELVADREEEIKREYSSPEYEGVDEKTPLLEDQLDKDIKQSKSRLNLLAKRLVDALTESLRWVLWKLASPGIYLVGCFYDEEGKLSPLLPTRRKRLNGLKNSSKAAHAVVMRTESGLGPASKIRKLEKRVTRSSTIAASEGHSTPTTSDSEPDAGILPGREEAVPSRRSIRIKLHHGESARKKKAGKGSDLATSSDGSVQLVSAVNLKSPTSPASSLRITKYPHTPAPPRPLVPRRQPSYSAAAPNQFSKLTQKTLIIDLDETLIHSLAKGGRMSSGHMVEVKLAHPAAYNGLSLGPQHPILYYVHKRPHCDDFLRKVCKWYNLVVFTASVQEYADPVIDWLEQERKYFSARYYRQHCTLRNGAYIKDLSSVEPDLSKVMILDNSPLSYIFHEGM